MPSQTILITGGASGIGAGIAARLVADGARVIIADRVQAIDTWRPLRGVRCRRRSRGENLISGIADTEGALTGLVCNAGFMIRKPIADLSLAEWNSVLATNLTSSFLLTRAAAGLLRAS